MDPQNVPLELISFRGLFKSFEDMQQRNLNPNKNENRNNIFQKTIKEIAFLFIFGIITFIEDFLYFLMSVYDDYVYSPLQITLSPICRLMPRYLYFKNRKTPIFTANIITLSRTFLVIPIALFLKFDYNFSAFLCVVIHDFLDHLDGIVAKVQRVTYPNHDDPILGGFLDAFCDKVVNILSIWSIIQTIDLNLVTQTEATIFFLICYSVIAYESIIGIIRVQDYFFATFTRDYKIDDKISNQTSSVDTTKVTMASMEGKLKEKLESLGIAFLCLSLTKSNENPINNAYGYTGLVCLLLTLRMAHKSLILKLNTRSQKKNVLINIPKVYPNDPEYSNDSKNIVWYCKSENNKENVNTINSINNMYEEIKISGLMQNNITEKDSNNFKIKQENDRENNTQHELFLTKELDYKVDNVYTIGCFDLFHFGHIQLIKRMRTLGKNVIIGVHDSRSIYKLKNRVPVDSTETRMRNVKKYAEKVFCIANTDPSIFISCIVNIKDNETALYVRGDDMINFPSKESVEKLMPIKFIPYTKGISSTEIRKDKFSHIDAHDTNYLERNE